MFNHPAFKMGENTSTELMVTTNATEIFTIPPVLVLGVPRDTFAFIMVGIGLGGAFLFLVIVCVCWRCHLWRRLQKRDFRFSKCSTNNLSSVREIWENDTRERLRSLSEAGYVNNAFDYLDNDVQSENADNSSSSSIFRKYSPKILKHSKPRFNINHNGNNSNENHVNSHVKIQTSSRINEIPVLQINGKTINNENGRILNNESLVIVHQPNSDYIETVVEKEPKQYIRKFPLKKSANGIKSLLSAQNYESFSKIDHRLTNSVINGPPNGLDMNRMDMFTVVAFDHMGNGNAGVNYRKSDRPHVHQKMRRHNRNRSS